MSQEIVRARATAAAEPSEEAITITADGSIRITYSHLKTPGYSYDADYAWLVRRNGAVSFFFGKENPDDPELLRTRVEVRYPFEAFLRHFWDHTDGRFRTRVTEYVTKLPRDNSHNRRAPEKMKAERDHSDWANFDYIAHHGTQAVLDFFNLSAAGVAIFLQGGGTSSLKIAPVLRVHTTAYELVRIMDAAEPIATALRAEFPDLLKQAKEV